MSTMNKRSPQKETGQKEVHSIRVTHNLIEMAQASRKDKAYRILTTLGDSREPSQTA